MEKIIFVLASVLFWNNAVNLSADAQADQIAFRYYTLKKPNDRSASATITIIDKSGIKSTLKFEILESFQEKSSLVRFIEPIEIAGMKFLTAFGPKGLSEQWIYLPALKIKRQIIASDKNSDFIQSDLSYYDMDNHDFKENSYRFLSEETLAGENFAGMKFFKIEMKPKNVQAPYDKSIAWINQKNYALYQLDVYDKRDQALWKTFTFQIKAVNDILIPVKTMVINHKRGSSTILELDQIKINLGLKKDLFSVKNLESFSMEEKTE